MARIITATIARRIACFSFGFTFIGYRIMFLSARCKKTKLLSVKLKNGARHLVWLLGKLISARAYTLVRSKMVCNASAIPLHALICGDLENLLLASR